MPKDLPQNEIVNELESKNRAKIGLNEESKTEGENKANDIKSEAVAEFEEHPKSSEIKRKQIRNLLLIILVGGVLFYFLYALVSSNSAHPKPVTSVTQSEKIEFVSPTNQDDAKSVWIERIQNQVQDAAKANQNLSQKLDDINKVQTEIIEQGKKQQDEFEELKDKINSFGSANKNGVSQVGQDIGPTDPMNQNNSAIENTGGLFPQANMPAGSVPTQPEPQIRIDKLNLGGSSGANGEPSTDTLKTAKNYVPAGTFVKAIMLGGADVAAGAISQADPMPMLFRILGNGTLPNNHHSNLKNCIVTAAVIGDISAEIGKIRLERMSCTRNNGKVIDLAVEGTVFGPSGKNGVRGKPVWREKELLQRAFVAGALSGVSEGISQKYTTTALNPSGAIQTINNDSIFKYGAAQGVGKAMDKLADYNIKRAEQYHPVIQISAGALVDIVFLKGFYLGEEKSDV